MDPSIVPTSVAAVAGYDFLKRLCGPAADEMGFTLKDQVRLWRLKNWVRLQEKARRFLEDKGTYERVSLHPRLMFEVIEKGTLTDDTLLIDMWAGLLAASCSDDGSDDSNLAFTEILSRMTSFEAKLLREICTDPSKMYEPGSYITASGTLGDNNFGNPNDSSSLMRNRALHHLTSMGLFRIVPTIEGGINQHMSTKRGVFELTTLGLEFFATCEGWKGPIAKFYGISSETKGQKHL